MTDVVWYILGSVHIIGGALYFMGVIKHLDPLKDPRFLMLSKVMKFNTYVILLIICIVFFSIIMIGELVTKIIILLRR